MDLGIRGRVALVTGASSGIGEAVALGIAREGATLAIAARRRERLEQIAAHAKELGASEARAFEVDFDDAASVRRLVDDVQSTFGSLDILVANGGGPKPGTFVDTPESEWDAAYHNTLRNMLELVHGALPGMRERHFGRIVALTSSSVKQPIGGLVLSNAFRTALVSALKTLSSEVASEGITVNAIATGRVLTERLRHLYPDDQAMESAAKAEVPIGRVASPQEFAPLVVFLCGAPASYVTGQTIAIDGGLIRSLY